MMLAVAHGGQGSQGVEGNGHLVTDSTHVQKDTIEGLVGKDATESSNHRPTLPNPPPAVKEGD